MITSLTLIVFATSLIAWFAADSARRRYRLVFSVLAVVALAGCATIVTAPSGMESSLIVGELKVHVVGTGVDPNGADGFINTISPYSLGMALRDKTTGQLFRLRADNAEGLFALPNAKPGSYELVELGAELMTSNTFIRITSTFDKGPSFEVKPGWIENLGINRWTFSFDLGGPSSANSFSLGNNFPAVAKALSRVDIHSRWAGRESDQVAVPSDVTTTPTVAPELPRDYNKIDPM